MFCAPTESNHSEKGTFDMFYSGLVKLPTTLPLAVEHVFAAF